jgi:hypothetical protein
MSVLVCGVVSVVVAVAVVVNCLRSLDMGVFNDVGTGVVAVVVAMCVDRVVVVD